MRRLLAITALAAVLAAAPSGPASAAPSTGRLRTLDCGAAGTIVVELGPAEFLSTAAAAIHVVPGTDVLLPRRVVVTTPEGDTFVVLDKPIPPAQADRVVTCSYVDPAGLQVTLTALLTPAPR
ncbi:MAG TPA: hypothetical protein VGB14_13655 [Acidimicrobiales bacterium]